MTVTPLEERPRDPFAVPSGTTLRFALLVLSLTAVVMSAVTGRVAPLLAGVGSHRAVADYQACWERENRATDSLPAFDAPSAEEVCGADPRVVELWVPVCSVAAFWLLVFLVYWFLPAWRIRRRRYVPLGDELPGLQQTLRALRRQAGAERVNWLVQPLDPRVSALAFGRWRRRHIVLSGGLLALRNREPETFEAVLLHELAHIRNRDVDISFLTIAAGRVGLPALLLAVPAGIGWPLIWGTSTGSFAAGAALSFQALSLLLVVPLSRRAVLRSREFYADARAQRWSTSPSALRALFDGRGSGRRRATLLRVHPTDRQRRAMLDDASALFRSGFWELLAVGCVLGALHSWIGNTFVFNAALGGRADAVKDLLAAAVTGTLVAAVVYFLALRADEGFPAGTRRHVLWTSAWGLGCGLALGGGVFDSGTVFALATTEQLGAGFLPWTGMLVLGVFLASRWVIRTAGLWRRALAGRRRPLLALCVPVVGTGLMFTLVVLWVLRLMVAEALMSKLMPPGTPELVSFALAVGVETVVRAPLLVCAVTLAALLPLLGQALASHGARSGARSGVVRTELRRTVSGGARCGLWLMLGVLVLGLSGRFALAPLPVAVALLVLAVRTGRRPATAAWPSPTRCWPAVSPPSSPTAATTSS